MNAVTAIDLSVHSSGGIVRIGQAASLKGLFVSGERLRLDAHDGDDQSGVDGEFPRRKIDEFNMGFAQCDGNTAIAELVLGGGGTLAFGKQSGSARVTVGSKLTFLSVNPGTPVPQYPYKRDTARFGAAKELRTNGLAPNVVSELSVAGVQVVFDLGAVTAGFTQVVLDLDAIVGTAAGITAINNAAWNLTLTRTATKWTVVVAAGTGQVTA